MKKVRKYIVYTLALFVILFIMAITFIQLPIGKAYILNLALDVANNNLNANIDASELSGNLFSEITLDDVSMSVNEQELIFIKRIHLEYELFEFLQDSVIINNFSIDSVNVNLVEDKNNGWNYLNIAKSDSTNVVENESSAFPYVIKLNQLIISNINAAYSPINQNKYVPNKINDFSLELSALYKDSHLEYKLSDFTLSTSDPSVKIEKLYTIGSLIDDNLTIADFDLSTAQNHILLNGNYDIARKDTSELNLKIENLILQEFSDFVDLSNLNMNPNINITAVLLEDDIEAKILVDNAEQSISIKGGLYNFEDNPNYNSILNLDKLNIAYILGDKQLPSNITGEFLISGEGFDIETNQLSVSGKLSDIETFDQKIDSLSLQFEKTRDSLDLITNLENKEEAVRIAGFIDNLFENQNYNLNISTENINLENYLSDASFNSNLNTSFKLIGNSFDFDKLSAEITLSAQPSHIKDFMLDTLYGKVNVKDKEFYIDSLYLQNKDIFANVAGLFSIENYSDIKLDGAINDLIILSSLAQIDSIDGNGEFNINLSGKLDSLNAEYNINLYDAAYGGNALKEGKIIGNSLIADSNLFSSNSVKLDKISIGSFLINNVELNSEMRNKLIENEISISINDSITLSLNPSILIDSTISVETKNISVKLPTNTWSNSEPFSINVDDKIITVQNFNAATSDQEILFSAVLNDTLLENTHLHAKDINLEKIYLPVPQLQSLSGIMNLDVQVEGSINDPQISSKLSLDNIYYDSYPFGNLLTNITAKSNQITWDLNLIDTSHYQIKSDGFFYYNLANENIVSLNSPFNFNLLTNNIELATLPIIDIDRFDISGIFNSDFSVTNTLSAPIIDGNISLKKGTLKNNFYGTNLSEINIILTGDSSKFVINEFTVREPAGSLDIIGYLTTTFDKDHSLLDPSEISIKAENFDLFDSERYALRLDGNLDFKVKGNEASFDGYFLIPRSRYYVPSALKQSSGKSVNQSTPILLREMKKDNALPDTVKIKETIPDTAKIEWAKNLSGKFTVDIPSNCWLRGPNINMEIFGKVDVIKDRENLSFLGQLQINRGYYTIFGKKFIVNEGRISFDGNPQFNPNIVLEVEYSFRDSEKQKRSLTLRVSNTVLAPEIQFSIDEEAIDQADAISYILFGKKKNELTQSQQSGIKSGEVAANLAANLLASQISNTFGSTLSLDVVEITGEDNWTRGSFTAGKYVTDDLFVQYEKGFGKDDDGTVDPQIFTLEYQITRLLFLQLIEATNKTSGIDLLIKFD